MSALFARVRLDPRILKEELPEVARVRSRVNALLRCLEEFGVVVASCEDRNAMGLDDAELDGTAFGEWERIREGLELKTIRLLDLNGAEFQGDVLSLNNWEQSPLGDLWRATVVKEGDGVVALLKDAFQANEVVVVMDPALGGLRERPQKARRKLLELCRDSHVMKLRVFSEYGLRRNDEERENEAPETKETVLKALQQEIVGFEWFGAAPDIEWRVRKHNGQFHDRYIGFVQRPPAPESYQAVTLGGGITSFVTTPSMDPRDTVVARIPGRAFESVLAHLERTKWQIELDFNPAEAASHKQEPG